MIETLAIVGVGLIGGSIGLAAKRRGLARRVVGVGWRQSTLNLAQDLGIIDEGRLAIPTAVTNAEVVVFCTPVTVIADQVLEAAPHCPPGALLTDAGSTKVKIVASIERRLPEGRHFVGSHPLAGSEKRGPEHASANLFQDRLTVVTPTPKTDLASVERTRRFWQGLGSRVKLMSPAEHDDALALTSHLPHLLAAALAGALPQGLHELTATGFRDTTRIAASDPGLWTGILMQNKQAVLAALATFQERATQFEAALSHGDEAALTSLLEEAKRVRDALGG